MKLDVPMGSDWSQCDHEWKLTGDHDLGGNREEVKCKKCQCPGERHGDTGEVDWPTT